jgi:hypothetical protein
MGPARAFDSVWYRAKPATESSRADPFTRERGTLVVGPGALRFEGPKLTLAMQEIEAVEYGVHGTMTNPSVHVRYRENGEPRSAWFTDGGMGGYSGMFGGTRRLAQELGHLAPVTFDDEGAGKMQKRLAIIIGVMILLFLTQVLRSAVG